MIAPSWSGLFKEYSLRGHLQTMICTPNVIVTLRGVLAMTLIIFILMQQNGNEAKNKWSSNMFAIHFVSKLLYLLTFSKLTKCDVKRRGGGGGGLEVVLL